MNKTLLIILAILCLGVHAVKGQNLHQLSGIVTDTLGKGVEHAIIWIQAVSDSSSYKISTNKDGQYVFGKLPEKEYTYHIYHDNYQSVNGTIYLNGNKELGHTLYPVKNVNLDNVVITADRSNVIKSNAQSTLFHLSGNARKEKSIYEALQEIPNLKVDLSMRKIKTADEQNVIILVNNMQRDTSIESIDPAEVESIEIMENPPVKYLKDGYATVLNIKLKKRSQTYRLLNLYNDVHPGMVTNSHSGSFETGNDKFSFYTILFWSGANHEKGNEYGEQHYSGTDKDYSVSTRHNSHNAAFYIGGDFVPNLKNYLSYSLYADYGNTKTRKWGEGSISQKGTSYEYDVRRLAHNRPITYAGKVLHQYRLNEKSLLESTLSYSYSLNKDNNCNHEYSDNYNYSNENRYKMVYQTGSYIAEYQKKWDNKNELTIGSDTYYINGKLDNTSTVGSNTFDYRSWNEYLYATYSSAKTPFSYMLSLGLDCHYNKIEDIKNQYYKIRVSGNASYSFRKHHLLKGYVRGYTSNPSISLLNPYNTSTDSLQAIKGNPYLEPSYTIESGVAYRFTKGSWYIEPDICYALYTDMYERIGRKEGEVYAYTYENKKRESQLIATLSARYNIKNVGHIGLMGRYRRCFFENTTKSWISIYPNWRFYYKNISLNGSISFQPYSHEEYSKRKNSTDCRMALNWNINTNWNVGIGMRYMIEPYEYAYSIDDTRLDYHSYINYDYPKRDKMLYFTVQYAWKHKAPKRKSQYLQQEKPNIQLLKE